MFLDSTNTIFMVLAGHPGSKEEWMKVGDGACKFMEEISPQVRASESANPRGDYKQLNVGVSMGGGQPVCPSEQLLSL